MLRVIVAHVAIFIFCRTLILIPFDLRFEFRRWSSIRMIFDWSGFSIDPAQKLAHALFSANQFFRFYSNQDLVLMRQNIGGKVLGCEVARERLEDVLVEVAKCGFDLVIRLDHDSWCWNCCLTWLPFRSLLLLSSTTGRGNYILWLSKILLAIDVISMPLLHSIIEEHLKSLVDHVSFLFLREVLSLVDIVDKHLLEVERVAGIFESVRPVVVVAVDGWLGTYLLDKVTSISSQNAPHADIAVKCSPLVRADSLILAGFAARTFIAFKDSSRDGLISCRRRLRRCLEILPSLNLIVLLVLNLNRRCLRNYCHFRLWSVLGLDSFTISSFRLYLPWILIFRFDVVWEKEFRVNRDITVGIRSLLTVDWVAICISQIENAFKPASNRKRCLHLKLLSFKFDTTSNMFDFFINHYI